MFADLLAQEARQAKWNVDLGSLNDNMDCFEKKSPDVVVFVSSVFGEGIPPDNAQKFCNAFLSGSIVPPPNQVRCSILFPFVFAHEVSVSRCLDLATLGMPRKGSAKPEKTCLQNVWIWA